MIKLAQYSKDTPLAKHLYLYEDGRFCFSVINTESAQIQSTLEGEYELLDDNLILQYLSDGKNEKVLLTDVDGQFHNNVLNTSFAGIWEKFNSEDSRNLEEKALPVLSSNVSLCRWMYSLPNSLRLTQLSIPGTHDSATRSVNQKDEAQTQREKISTQLNDGIRYLDFRIGHSYTTKELELFHGVLKCHMTFYQGMKIVTDFLRQNPSETVFLSIQKETHEQGNFAKECSGVLAHFREFIYPGHDLPSLGAARGKIILLASSAEISFIGINGSGLKNNEEWSKFTSGNVTVCANSTYRVLDNGFTVKQRANKKIEIIKKFLDGQTYEANTLDFNNWNHQWTPFSAIEEYAILINRGMRNTGYFNDTRHHGIQIMDYYLKDNVKDIINNNFQFIKK